MTWFGGAARVAAQRTQAFTEGCDGTGSPRHSAGECAQCDQAMADEYRDEQINKAAVQFAAAFDLSVDEARRVVERAKEGS